MSTRILWGSLLIFAVTACDDPTEGKTRAEVTSAAPTSTAPAATGARYELASDASKLEWVGSKVTGHHDGGFKSFTANVQLPDDGTIEGGSVEVEIDSASIFSDDERLTKHLKSGDFFEVEKFPKASFKSTKIDKGGADGASHTMHGNLTLHGETKGITFPASIAKDGDAITVKSEFVINRKDFGIVYKGKPDDLIKDDVVIKLDLRLTKKG
jgi:polyisoprenoid-binding protein YceI